MAVLREHTLLEVACGERRESFLFARGMYVGSADALARLRALLATKGPVEATLVSNDTLVGLYGPSVNAMSLVLDLEGKLTE